MYRIILVSELNNTLFVNLVPRGGFSFGQHQQRDLWPIVRPESPHTWQSRSQSLRPP